MSLESTKTALSQLIRTINFARSASSSAGSSVSATRGFCDNVDARAGEWSGDALTKIPGDPGVVVSSAITFEQAAASLKVLATAFSSESSAITSSMDAKAGAASALELDALDSLATLESDGLTVVATGLRAYSNALDSAQMSHEAAAKQLAQAKTGAGTYERPGDDVLPDDPEWTGPRLQGVVNAGVAVLDDAKAAAQIMLDAVEDAIAAARQLGYAYSDGAGYQRMDHVVGTGSAGYVQTMLALVHDVDDPDKAIVSDGEWKQYQQQLEKLSDKDREKVAKLLTDARTPEERQLIISAFATGAGLQKTEAFAKHVSAMSPSDLDRLTKWGVEEETKEFVYDTDGDGKYDKKGWETAVFTKDAKRVAQQTDTTCGPSSLLMLAAQRDPFLALYLDSGTLIDGHKPAYIADLKIWDDTGMNKQEPMPGHQFIEGYEIGVAIREEAYGLDTREMSSEKRLEHIQTELRQRTNMGTGWPGMFVGSFPGAMDEEIARATGGSATMDYQNLGGHSNPESLVNQTVAAVNEGQPVPLLVGDGTIPMHYVLAVSHKDGVLTVYEPSSGELRDVHTEDMLTNYEDPEQEGYVPEVKKKEAYGGWSHLYGAGLPAK